MKIKTFETIDAAMKYIIANKLSVNFHEIEKTLQSKQVVKIKGETIFIDEQHLLD